MLNEGLHLLEAVIADFLLGGTLEIARLSGYLVEVEEDVGVHLHLGLITQTRSQHFRRMLCSNIFHDCQRFSQVDPVRLVDEEWQAWEWQIERIFGPLPLLLAVNVHVEVVNAEVRQHKPNRLS